jgi:uncharacterized membrane protein YgdD (TMEM256/DUF423 family)
MEKTFLLWACIFGGLAVALGAFGAHALALLGVAAVLVRWPHSSAAMWAGWLFVAGVVIFSGSLYVLVFSGVRWLGAVTPIGGVAMIAGWISLALAAWRN